MAVPGLKDKERRALCSALGELGEQAQRLLRSGRYLQVIELLSEAIDAGNENVAALVLLADVHLTDAREVMVDQLEAKAELALQLLERARESGYADAAAERLRVSVARFLERERRERARVEARTQLLLAGGARASKLKSRQIGDCATALWRRKDYARAAQLFRLAEAAAAREPAPIVDGKVRTQNAFNHRIRGLICAVQAGELERVRDELEPALTFDWNAGGIVEDRYITEWLFMALLERAAAAEDWPVFRRWWQRAAERGDELQFPFPWVHPHQELLLELCVRAGLRDLVPVLAARIRSRDRVPDALLERLRLLEQPE